MKHIKKLLSEATQKQGSIEDISSFANDPNIYIIFHGEGEKIGINPKKNYRDTPPGIYSHPIKHAIQSYFDKDTGTFVVPHIPQTELVSVIYTRGRVIQSSVYTKKDLEKDNLKLRQWFIPAFMKKTNKSEIFAWECFKGLLYSAATKGHSQIPAGILWTFVKYLWTAMYHTSKLVPHNHNKVMINQLDYNNHKINIDFFVKPADSDVHWNIIFRDVLGYDGFVDDQGNEEIIKKGENSFAIFFKTSGVNVLTTLFNKSNQQPSKLIVKKFDPKGNSNWSNLMNKMFEKLGIQPSRMMTTRMNDAISLFMSVKKIKNLRVLNDKDYAIFTKFLKDEGSKGGILDNISYMWGVTLVDHQGNIIVNITRSTCTFFHNGEVKNFHLDDFSVRPHHQGLKKWIASKV